MTKKDGRFEETHQEISIHSILNMPERNFAVYKRTEGGYTLLASKGSIITQKHVENLSSVGGVKHIFIAKEEIKEYEKFCEKHFGDILNNPEIEYQERAETFVKIHSKNLMSTFLEKLPNGLSKATFDKFKDLVKKSIDFLTDPKGLEHISKLIGHNYVTYKHSLSVFSLSLPMISLFTQDRELIARCSLGALLHDIGKTQISVDILDKPGRLTKEEFETIKTHPKLGIDVCSQLPIAEETKEAILLHHEKMDGKGYPHQIQNDEIPIHVRIITICDIYDAISSKRPYADAEESFETLRIMKEEMIQGIDVGLFQAFIIMLADSNILEIGSRIGKGNKETISRLQEKYKL